MLRVISTDKAPAAVGPYSQAIAAGGFSLCFWTDPLNPLTGELVTDFEGSMQTVTGEFVRVSRRRRVSVENIVKVNIYVRDMGEILHTKRNLHDVFRGTQARESCR